MVRREVTVQRTARFVQVCGKFDLPTERTSVREWEVDLRLPEDWQVMVIVGPSMSGKSTIAHELFPGELVDSSGGRVLAVAERQMHCGWVPGGDVDRRDLRAAVERGVFVAAGLEEAVWGAEQRRSLPRLCPFGDRLLRLLLQQLQIRRLEGSAALRC